jgi:5-amino-6-(5-phospho-D-ribitylamino)uracil phosphatase
MLRTKEEIMKQYLIALDLDGTTLYDWQTLTDETIETIKKVKDLGHKIAIATGRPYRSSKKFYDQLGLDTPIINYNGALIQHPFDKDFTEQEKYIPLMAVNRIFDEMEEYIENAFCEHYEDIYLVKNNETILPLVHPEGGKIIEGSFKDTLQLNPNGFILVAKPGKHHHIENFIDEHFKGQLGHRNWGGEAKQIIEVFSPETCKGIALRYLADYYQIPMEQTMAFGDGHNDTEMIREAGIGVAMANAVEEVKKVSDHMTLSNKENGVAHFLKDYFKL